MVESVFLDVNQFAERSGLPVTVIKKLVTQGKIVAHTIGRKVLISAAQLDGLERVLLDANIINKGTAHVAESN